MRTQRIHLLAAPHLACCVGLSKLAPRRSLKCSPVFTGSHWTTVFDVRFVAHCGPQVDIVGGPKSAASRHPRARRAGHRSRRFKRRVIAEAEWAKGAGVMFSLLRLGRSGRTRSDSSAN